LLFVSIFRYSFGVQLSAGEAVYDGVIDHATHVEEHMKAVEEMRPDGLYYSHLSHIFLDIVPMSSDVYIAVASNTRVPIEFNGNSVRKYIANGHWELIISP
jgi:hypothetical protein